MADLPTCTVSPLTSADPAPTVLRVARIALDVPVPALYDYLADGLDERDIGRRFLVPFGPRQRVGLLVGLAEQSEVPSGKLRALGPALDEGPLLLPSLFGLMQACASYYHHPLGSVLFAALPARLRDPSPLREDGPGRVVLTASGREALATLPGQARLQRALRDALDTPQDWDALKGRGQTAGPLLRKWLDAGWLAAAESQLLPVIPVGGMPLTAAQEAAVGALRAEEPGPSLLFGVTGSGKTEVYMARVADTLAAGKQALVLVPEINLTPQLLARFRARFPTVRLACLHSEVADGERAREWLACLRGERDLVIGTRLAVFTPLARLGLIVVDEEHDASYKQQEGFRYSARDVAVWRGQREGVPVLLGSATPSLESWWNARQGRYRRHDLPGRATGASLPPIALLDTRRENLVDGLSPRLLTAIADTLGRGEQALVFLNRRGYAPVLACDACGWLASCRRCSARMVLHRPQRRLLCHHCGAGQVIPRHCPDCGNADLKPLGVGTQRLEMALASQFPQARLLRVDRDSMSRKGSWEAAQAQIAAGEADLLVGTQMLAKGHDFPRLTLVGVANADASLASADFRAEERLFAQLLQVAGRAGRADRPGRVLVQSRYPDHPLFAALAKHDFPGFAERLLVERRDAAFPPFCYQALLRAEAKSMDVVLDWLQQARSSIPAHDIMVYDPVPALMTRVDGRERGQLLLQATRRVDLQRALRMWTPQLYAMPARGVRWTLDVDPLDV